MKSVSFLDPEVIFKRMSIILLLDNNFFLLESFKICRSFMLFYFRKINSKFISSNNN